METTSAVKPLELMVKGDVTSPNETLPVLVYQGAFPANDADEIERRLTANGWVPGWRDPTGFFPFHHFHSKSHELLAVVSGEVGGRFGADGVLGTAKAGDVIVLPAGTDHVAEFASEDLLIVGAYPPETQADICRGEPELDAEMRENIANVPVPSTDPVSGAADGYMQQAWTK